MSWLSHPGRGGRTGSTLLMIQADASVVVELDNAPTPMPGGGSRSSVSIVLIAAWLIYGIQNCMESLNKQK